MALAAPLSDSHDLSFAEICLIEIGHLFHSCPPAGRIPPRQTGCAVNRWYRERAKRKCPRGRASFRSLLSPLPIADTRRCYGCWCARRHRSSALVTAPMCLALTRAASLCDTAAAPYTHSNEPHTVSATQRKKYRDPVEPEECAAINAPAVLRALLLPPCNAAAIVMELCAVGASASRVLTALSFLIRIAAVGSSSLRPTTSCSTSASCVATPMRRRSSPR